MDFENRKKKKKKSFLQQAKKFGKRGHFGKGQNIDGTTYNYFVQVLATLDKNEFEDDEAKDIFVANVFSSNQESGEEELCCNQLISRVFEKLMPLADNSVKFRFMEKLGQDLRKYASNPFASHVLESLLLVNAFKQPSNQKDSDEDLSQKKEWIFKVAKYCINNFADFAVDPYAAHILRNIFQCLSGVKLSADLMKSKKAQSQAQSKLDLAKIQTDECIFNSNDERVMDVFQLACQKIEDSENLTDLCTNDVSSGVFQSLLIVLSKISPRLCKKMAKYFTNEIFAEKDDTMFDNAGVTRLLESLIQVSGEDEAMRKIYTHFYEKIFKDSLFQLSTHQTANFAVQKLMHFCPTKELFESMYEEELDAKLEQILASGSSSGVILSVAQTCRRLGCKQAHFIVALSKALQCNDNSDKLFVLLTRLATSDAFDENSPLNLHGTLLAQEILQFNKPIKLVNSLLSTNPDKLIKILSDPRGCHITDAFMASSTIGEKSRENLLKIFTPENLAALACSKHGSRSIDAIWAKASPKLRETMAAKLVNQMSKLNSDNYGKYVSTNLGLAVFNRSREQWKANFEKEQKTKKLFSEFLQVPEIKKDVVPANAKKVEEPEFVIDKCGDENLFKRKYDSKDEKAKAKKKIKKSSYLDDL